MQITGEQRTKLAHNLFEELRRLQREDETFIKKYEIAFQGVIEDVFLDKRWWDVTECEIFMHLIEHKDPEKTIIAILKGLKED
jgi:hypothetical protein